MKITIDEKLQDRDQSLKAYRTPEGYFETLPDKIFERIKREELEFVESLRPLQTRRGKVLAFVRPYLYLAATFLIVMGTFKLFEGSLSRAGQKQAPTSMHTLGEGKSIAATLDPTLDDFDLIYADLIGEKAEEQWLQKAYSAQ